MIDVTGIQHVGQLRTRLLPPMPMISGLNELNGAVKFYIGVNLTADEFKNWSPQKITNFFNGIIQVIQARGVPRQ